tara:strand:- start:6900 stop:7823 length:924 start_codon:yes stop_codon:yes gene_type:complete
MKTNLSIIAPCFNEEKNILTFYDRLILIINKLGLDYSFCFIDDGSTDKTWEIIKSLKLNDPKVKGIKFSRNFGHQSALYAGIQKVNGDFIVILDVDLQDPPELIVDMFKKITDEKLNLVYAQRDKSYESFFKKFTSRVFYKIFNFLAEIKIPENTSDFRIFDKKIHKELKKFKEQNPFYRGIFPWIGFKSGKVLFNRPNRAEGETGWSIKKMINFSIDGILSFSNYPMRLSFYLSIFMSIVFIFLSMYAILSFLLNNVIPGWTSIFIIVSFFNIIIFFLLGLISEYVGRIHLQIKNRPNFIVDEEIE